MPVAVTSGADGQQVAPTAFRFVASRRPLVQGTIGAVIVLVALVAWAWASGRIRNIDATYAAVLVASAVGSVAFVTGRIWRNARNVASKLGRIELDDAGIRWRRTDGSLGFDASWKDIARGTRDARNSTLILFRTDGAPILVGALSPHGVPSGFVVLERFGDIVDLVARRIPVAAHEGSADVSAGRRTALLGAGACGTAVALYAANLLVSALLRWNRLLIPMPLFVGAVGLLLLVAGVRVSRGRGPLVSPLYGPGYRATLVRFLVTASLANFVLVAVVNAFAR